MQGFTTPRNPSKRPSASVEDNCYTIGAERKTYHLKKPASSWSLIGTNMTTSRNYIPRPSAFTFSIHRPSRPD